MIATAHCRPSADSWRIRCMQRDPEIGLNYVTKSCAITYFQLLPPEPVLLGQSPEL